MNLRTHKRRAYAGMAARCLGRGPMRPRWRAVLLWQLTRAIPTRRGRGAWICADCSGYAPRRL